jgi:hypothetical protein
VQILDEDKEKGLTTIAWEEVQNNLRTLISNKVLARCKSSKGTQLEFFYPRFKKVCAESLCCACAAADSTVMLIMTVYLQILCGPATDRGLLAFIGKHQKDHQILRKSRIDQNNNVWDEQERIWLRSSIPPHCMCCYVLYMTTAHVWQWPGVTTTAKTSCRICRFRMQRTAVSSCPPCGCTCSRM